jgi:hypothetical protein
MITLFIILACVFIYYVVKAQTAQEKKVDVVDNFQRNNAIDNLPAIRYVFPDRSRLEKVLTIGDDPLAVFSYSDTYIFVKYKDGKGFTAHLDQIDVLFRFDPATNSRFAQITFQKNIFTITEWRDSTISEYEWDKIFDVLQCAKITHQRDLLTKESRENAVRAYQTSRIVQRTMRRF